MAIPNFTLASTSRTSARVAALLSLVALLSVLTTVVSTASAYAQAGTVGCDTDRLEVSSDVGAIELVGNDGPAAATSTVELSESLTPGTYAVRTVSMDSHWSERRDQPREQYTVTVGNVTVGPTSDLPADADFIGTITATSADENLGNVPVDVFPGEQIGTITITENQSAFTLTHVDGGEGNGSNSISAHNVTFTCIALGLDISFGDASQPFADDGTATAELTISNTGEANQTGIRVRSVLPIGLDRNGDIATTSGTTTSIGATIRWEGDLAASESVTLSVPVITTREDYTTCAGETGVCTMTAEIVGADEGATIMEPASIDFTATADLEVTSTYSPANGDFEQLAGTLTVVVSNVPDGFMNIAANDLVVATDFASSLSIDASSVGVTVGSVEISEGTLRWNVGSIAVGDSAAYSIGVTLPSVGAFSARSQVVESTTTDPDSSPNTLAARTSDDDTTVVEDDEAASLVSAIAPTTTTTSTTTTTFTTTSLPTTTTRAPLLVEVESSSDEPVDSGPAFQLDLTEQEIIDLTGLDASETGTPDDDRTEVAGAIELPADNIAVIDVDQSDRVPLAAFVAGLLVLLSAAIVLADRQNNSKLQKVAVTNDKFPNDSFPNDSFPNDRTR